MEHADLDCVQPEIIQYRSKLGFEKRHRHRLDGRYAEGVLGGQGSDGIHAVAAAGRKGLEVGLDAGAASAVGAGYRK